MSCNSRNSNVESGGCNSGMISNVEAGGFNSRGFPVKCKCGLDVVMLTSSTPKNPGRPFFRCKSCKDDHLFKWVEDCMYDRVERRWTVEQKRNSEMEKDDESVLGVPLF
ncbi:uncharacterized protein At1g43920, Chloroplastic isoform X2 [Arabidopsis lyrata subsp. lyrata]|uniref:uncharacterized protein At1g43920, Chloroplastic isoform X2 n=1 Tax=Arabidopsis lyrata subsp. lyrata TaxID=81972 RepID=UPI000A29A2F8|nr:uncharacterized protein At1g43920, Chloroplastic isoform X2 [Arabidopsis lyrata subsp. lyrata]|eukprot:XP_020878962.1 uncharacterized protein At1g43920, Chloroplastic isoform X2 [Arabidopsis lyrata subsp. lyrata]